VPLAFELLAWIERRIDRYHGRLNVDLPPQEAATKKQMNTSSFLIMWTCAVQQMVSLCQLRMKDEDFSEITGAPPGWLEERRYQPGLLSAKLQFDVRELDPEFVSQIMKAVNEAVIPQDVNGLTDRAKWTMVQWRMISPRLARELVQDGGAANKKLYDEVKLAIALMWQGNEAEYVEMDPTANTKLKFASQVVSSNPNYTQALQNPQVNPRFRELLQKWVMNLQFSITQEQNKQVGAIGVKPEQQMQGAAA